MGGFQVLQKPVFLSVLSYREFLLIVFKSAKYVNPKLMGTGHRVLLFRQMLGLEGSQNCHSYLQYRYFWNGAIWYKVSTEHRIETLNELPLKDLKVIRKI